MAEPDLIFRTLTAADAAEHPDLWRGWCEALLRGFHESRTDDERQRLWLESTRADDIVTTGAWPAATTVGSGTLPVATFASWTGGGLNVGGGRQVPLHMITDVTVSPTHRRQGLLRRLMTDDLRSAAGRGLTLAGLTATEGSIYGRFGFGPATRLRTVEVDVTGRFSLRPFDDDGTLELVEPAEAWDALTSVFARHCAGTRGALPWPGFYEPMLTARYDFETGSANKKARVVLHLDADGAPDGFALYEHAGDQDGRATLDVKGLVALTDAGYLRLWQFLADVDLTERVRFRRSREVEPLEWALVEPRVVRTTGAYDLLWLRVLDVVAALEARPWYGDGTVVLGVEDSLGLTDGRWRVSVSDARADVAPTEEPAEVRLSAETLGALYLGGIDVATLTAAGRVVGEDGALERWSAMADGGPTPYCTTGF
ncbi:MAG: GNAT family N-acetyltransferase [Nocardioides sp.]|uniref:GNAT family N-acetyltransferase n=1 Tax=Nocardioides sp. TaxID=35761 RepID=UPI00239C4AE5|nr:GNAT family N-acetyltransferase [Nocardioides sp.]MDE0775332.1 GNAT family N-acetyltransferase [Nocardioides sp.]